MSYRQIANHLGISHSTISREVRRNSSEQCYCPQGAHQQALVRRHGSGKRRMSEKVFTFVELALGWKWSPEQISGVGDFDFTYDGYQYSGYTVELIMQQNGNLRTSGLNANQW